MLNQSSERKMERKDIFTQFITTANTTVYFSSADMFMGLLPKNENTLSVQPRDPKAQLPLNLSPDL